MNLVEIVIKAGVEKLKKDGHTDCTGESIFTEPVHRKLFIDFLVSRRHIKRNIDAAIDLLFKKIDAAEKVSKR